MYCGAMSRRNHDARAPSRIHRHGCSGCGDASLLSGGRPGVEHYLTFYQSISDTRWEPSPLSIEADVPDHWANGLSRAKRLSPSAWIGIPAGKTVAGSAGRAAGNPGALTNQDLLGTWNAAGRRSTGVVAAVSQCIAGGRQGGPLGVQVNIRPHIKDRVTGLIGDSHTGGIGIPAGEGKTLSDGDRAGERDALPVRHDNWAGNILGGRAACVVAVIDQRVLQPHPLGIEREVRIEWTYRLPRLVGRAGAVWLAVPIQEAVAGSCGDNGGQGDRLALWDILLSRKPFHG